MYKCTIPSVENFVRNPTVAPYIASKFEIVFVTKGLKYGHETTSMNLNLMERVPASVPTKF